MASNSTNNVYLKVGVQFITPHVCENDDDNEYFGLSNRSLPVSQKVIHNINL